MAFLFYNNTEENCGCHFQAIPKWQLTQDKRVAQQSSINIVSEEVWGFLQTFLGMPLEALSRKTIPFSPFLDLMFLKTLDTSHFICTKHNCPNEPMYGHSQRSLKSCTHHVQFSSLYTRLLTFLSCRRRSNKLTLLILLQQRLSSSSLLPIFYGYLSPHFLCFPIAHPPKERLN